MSDARNLLAGTWEVQAGPPVDVTGRATVGWELGFLVHRSAIASPVPDSMAVIVPAGEDFTYHYFDERGVVRLYAMTLRDGRWTLERTTPDFSPLDFWQRYDGVVSDDAVVGRWEASRDEGATWELDFEVTWRRVA